MRKFILVAATVATLAVPAVASANVSVTDGVGYVGKGDVQTALKWNNGDFDRLQGSLAFTGGMIRTTDNVWSCTNGVGEQHSYRVTEMRQTFAKTAVLSSNGKQIVGWNLSGATAPNAVISDTGIPAETATCPAGSSLDFSKPLSINQLGVPKYTTYSYGGLQVNGIDLPNTPVEVAPVA